MCQVFDICPKRAVLKNKISLAILLSSLIFIFSSLKKNFIKFFYNGIPLPWALAFSYHTTSLALSLQNPLDHVNALSLKIVF